jgi:hypothetical protein
MLYNGAMDNLAANQAQHFTVARTDRALRGLQSAADHDRS